MRRVLASDLQPHPSRHRLHGEKQGGILRELIERQGFCVPVVARECEGGALQILDGHLRAQVAGDAEIPVLVLDLTEDEALLALATKDRIREMAGRDVLAIDSLLSGLSFEMREIADDLGLLKDIGDVEEDLPAGSAEGDGGVGEIDPAAWEFDFRCDDCGFEF